MSDAARQAMIPRRVSWDLYISRRRVLWELWETRSLRRIFPGDVPPDVEFGVAVAPWPA